mgnify:CR=1 FL=1
MTFYSIDRIALVLLAVGILAAGFGTKRVPEALLALFALLASILGWHLIVTGVSGEGPARAALRVGGAGVCAAAAVGSLVALAIVWRRRANCERADGSGG